MARKRIKLLFGTLVGSSNNLKSIQSKRLIMQVAYIPQLFSNRVIATTPVGIRNSWIQ